MNDNNDTPPQDPKITNLRQRFSEVTNGLSQEDVKNKSDDDTPPILNYIIEAQHDGLTTCYVKTGYLYVSSSFVAVCKGRGVIVLLIPANDLISVEEMEEDEIA